MARNDRSQFEFGELPFDPVALDVRRARIEVAIAACCDLDSEPVTTVTSSIRAPLGHAVTLFEVAFGPRFIARCQTNFWIPSIS